MLSIPTPLTMQSPAPTLDELKRRLAQLDTLVADGVLTGAAAKQAREQLEKQVLALVLGTPAGSAPAAAQAAELPAPRAPRSLQLAVSAFVLVFGLAGYAAMGNRAGWSVSPGNPGAPAAEQANAPHPTDDAQIQAMIDKLAERLKKQPDDADGWTMLGRSYTAQGRHSDALSAYKHVVELRPEDAQAVADYADSLAMVNNRSLDGEPEQLIAKALKLDPNNVKALALAGSVSFNHANYKEAAALWERAIKVSEPGSPFARELQGALDEARQRAGVAPGTAAPATAAATPPADKTTTQAAAPAGAAVSGRVTLSAALKGQVSPDDTVFIFARAPTGSKMPLAILRKKVSDLPMDFTLDDSLAMSPAMRLSTQPQVVVGARISKSGGAMAAPGDLQALSAPVALGAKALKLEIGEVVR
jgi:cytochrome c-type biogenesis protein CcmH